MVLGAPDSKIKTGTIPRTGQSREPVGELPRFSWTVISSEKELSIKKCFLTYDPAWNYEQLCNLDLLGLEEVNEKDAVYENLRNNYPDQENNCTRLTLLGNM